MDRRAEAVAALEARIGHAFSDRDLLEHALTHASVGDGSKKVRHNERLEFLGDRVLGLVAAERLMRDAETEREGALTRRLTAVVSGTACARVARRLGLGPALRLAGSTASQGGRDNDTILGDAMEALMAAIYLDGGLEAARRVFDLGWSEELAVEAEPEREPKTALQEWAMARKLPLPAYEVVGRHGPDHAPMFKVEVQVQGFPPAQAEGRSRQLAEKAAAQALLSREATHG